MSRRKNNQKTKLIDVPVPTIIKLGTLALLEKDLFEKTMKGKDGITEYFYQILLQSAESIRDKAIFRVLWETGARVSELVTLKKEYLEGHYLTVLKKKQQFICMNCNIHKRSHKNIGKTDKKTNDNSCLNYNPKVEERFKQILLSPETVSLLRVLFVENKSKRIFPYSDRYIREIMKQYHKKLSPHDFRRGKGIWMMKNGASKEQVVALLGHSDYQSLKHYISHQENELNEFLACIYEGKDTRKVSDLSVYELKSILGIE